MKSEITPRAYFVSANGGEIDFVRDGEILATIAIPPGRVRAAEYLDLLPHGAHVETSKGLAVLSPRSGYGVQDYGNGALDTGANPDFQPTSADRMAREIQLMMNRMKAATSRVEARERALALVERMPEAPAPAPDDGGPVVE